VLLRLIYLAIVNLFSALRLLSMSERDRDAEILVLRHQISLLQRQLGEKRVRVTSTDRAILSALLSPLPRTVLRRLHLLVRPDTVLRWHRGPAPSPARESIPRRTSRPPTHRALSPNAGVAPGQRESPGGIPAGHGELAALGVKVAASTVWEILKTEGIDPAPQRASTSWATFLRSQVGWPRGISPLGSHRSGRDVK